MAGIQYTPQVETTQQAFPESDTCWHDESEILVGNPPFVNLGAVQLYGFWNHQSPAADGDEFRNYAFLAAGTYDLKTLWKTGPTRGKVDFYVDGVVVGTVDGYSASGTNNVVLVISSISIPSNGIHEIRGKTNGKNASATDYRIALTKFWFVKV